MLERLSYQASIQPTLLTPSVRAGDSIIVVVKGENALETTLELYPPDTVVIFQPHKRHVGGGSFSVQVEWTVTHVQKNICTMVQIAAFSGGVAIQRAMCRISA